MIRTGYWYSFADGEGTVYVDGAVHERYSYDDQQWCFEMPMTYFVRLSR